MFVISAFILGLLVALNPCQLAINLSALTYLKARSEDGRELRRKGIIYILGRTFSYSLLGIILMLFIRKGLSIGNVQHWLSRGEALLPFLLFALAAFLLYRTFHHHQHHGGECHNCGTAIRRSGPSGALVLGLLLAFAFCPESAIIYFGTVIPLSVANAMGWVALIMFAFAAAVPVIILLWFMQSATKHATRFQHRFSHFQQWVDGLMALACVAAGVWMLFFA